MRSVPVTIGRVVRRLGPGLVSGASDNDPTTVATLAIIGASTVYGLAWLVVLIIPMLAVVQAIASRVGAVSKKGLQDCIRYRYGRLLSLAALFAVMTVNIVTLAADLEGGGAALQIMTGIDYRWFVVPLAALAAVGLVLGRAGSITNVLKYLTIIFFAYVATAFFAHPNWIEVLRGSLLPHLEKSPAYVSGVIALLGTTLTSYAYVWQSVETSQARPPLRRIALLQTEAVVGIVLAGIIFGSSSSRAERRSACTTNPSRPLPTRQSHSCPSPESTPVSSSLSVCSAPHSSRYPSSPGRART